MSSTDQISNDPLTYNRLGYINQWANQRAQRLWETWLALYPDKLSAIAHAIWFTSIDKGDRGIWNPLKFYSIKREFCRRHTQWGVPVYQKNLPCLTCQGGGVEPGRKRKSCSDCGGTGVRRSFWIYSHHLSLNGETMVLHAEAVPPLIVRGNPPVESFSPIRPSVLPYTGLVRMLSYVAVCEFGMSFYNGCYHPQR